MFRHLCESHPTETPELVTTHRMTDPADRAAAEALRDGRIDRGPRPPGGRRAPPRCRRRSQPLRRDAPPLVGRPHRGSTRIPWSIVAIERGDQLNRLARRLLTADGQLGSDEIEASGGRGFAVGDEVVARMAARHLHAAGQPSAYVRNGAVGTVVGRRPRRRSGRATGCGSSSRASASSTCPAGSSTNTMDRAVVGTSASTTPTPSPATRSRAPPTTVPPAGSTRAPAAPRPTSTSPAGGDRTTCSSPEASTRSTANTSPRPRPHRWSRASVRASRSQDRNEPHLRSILTQRDPVTMTGPPRSLVVGHTELQHTRFQRTSFVGCPLPSASPFMSFDIGKGPSRRWPGTAPAGIRSQAEGRGNGPSVVRRRSRPHWVIVGLSSQR